FERNEEQFEIQKIEANSFRKISMEMPSGSLLVPSQTTWEPSVYGFFDQATTDLCYDVNGITPEIKEKILQSKTVQDFFAQDKSEFKEIDSQADLLLTLVSKVDGQLTFTFEIIWSIDEKDCSAQINTTSDFESVILQPWDEDGNFFECSYT
ncbi:MAG: hypothetical protein KC505_01195, partial [Myxococcales bacterium]|nr:hypothetical protein [Myxococcales bacterium]